MAEELNLETKVTELEGRLAKATEAYKALKAENEQFKNLVEFKDKEFEKAAEYTKTKIKELEDELTINGNASEEIKALNERLEKAKTIFKEQKEKIAQQTELLTKLSNENTELSNNVTELTNRTKEDVEIINKYERSLKSVQAAIQGVLTH